MPRFAVRLIVCLERFYQAATMPEPHLLAPLSHLSGPFKEHHLIVDLRRAPAAELLRLLLFLPIHHLRFDFFQPRGLIQHEFLYPLISLAGPVQGPIRFLLRGALG